MCRTLAVVVADVLVMALPLLAQGPNGICSDVFPNKSNAVCAASLGFAKIVFVTTNAYDGNLGGTAGGNAICQTEANAAALPGTYKAWLSSSDTYGGDAALPDEPLNTFNHSTVPYVLADSKLTVVAANWSQFASVNHKADIGKDAKGNVVPPPGPHEILGVWTGTNPDGSATANNCSNWTSNANFVGGTAGYVNAISQPVAIFGNWTDQGIPGGAACNDTGIHLYCVQQ